MADHLFGEGSLEAHEWAEATLVRLCLAEVQDTIDDLESLNPGNAQAREEVKKLITYLNNNAHRINYLENLETGYAIGSGAIESANKFISHT
ncbi:MAG: ISKra4 family transposase, partial [Deltaproteobacteria bacterium]|nr:ISKra4 family transposase [Deltaproteobacteria bacterium]